MKALFKFCTVTVLILNGHASFANKCEDVELGSTGRDYWVDSIGNGFRGDFESQIFKRDELFDKLIPEFEFQLNDYLTVKSTFEREVQDFLPRPMSGQIASDDFFKLQIQNKFNIEVGASIDGPFLFAGGNAGVNLTHTSFNYPGKDLSSCEVISNIIDRDSEQGIVFFNSICEQRDKIFLTKWYEGGVDVLSSLFRMGLDYFTENEKTKLRTKKLLDPLKIHSTLGFPIDRDIFYENNMALNYGDLIEHTTYFGITPGGVKVNFFDILTPSYSKFARIFRTMSFRKEIKNQLTVEIEDVVIHGEDTTIYKWRPKILKYLKLNFGIWNLNDYKQDRVVQRFSIDLNHKQGREFLEKILQALNVYVPSFPLGPNKILIDASSYLDGVKVNAPIYTDSKGHNNKIAFNIPELLKFKKFTETVIEETSYDDIKIDENAVEVVDNRKFTNGEKYLVETYQNKMAFDLGLFEIKKADKNFECTMKLSVDSSVGHAQNSSMNINCNYFNRFASDSTTHRLIEYLDMITLGQLPEEESRLLKEIHYEQRDILNMYSNLSFSKESIENILNASDDDIYHLIAKLLFGQESKNIFATKFHKKWRSAPNKNQTTIAGHRENKKLSSMSSCSLVLKELGITTSRNRETYYDKFGGIVGKGKGLDGLERYRCYSYFLLAKDTVKSINKLQTNARNKNKLDQFLEVFKDLNRVGFVQAVLGSLGGGVSRNNVHLTYMVSSPQLENIIISSNGDKYEVEPPKISKSLASEARSQMHPRVSTLKFINNVCQPDIILAVFKLNYEPQDRKKIYGKFRLTDYKYFKGKGKVIGEFYVSFDQMIRNTQGEYIARIQLDKGITENEAYSMYFEVMNEHDFRLSREIKVYLKKTKTILDDLGISKD